MRLTHVLSDDGTLLDYAMVTNPDPLGVGSAAFITIVASAPEGPSVNVRQIAFSLPVGDPDQPDPTDLTDTALPRDCAKISSSGSDVWTIAPSADPSLFFAKPPDEVPIAVGPQGLTIMFTGITVSPLVGTATIAISEWASATGTPPMPDEDPSGSTVIAVPKFPAEFYVGNFKAMPPAVQNGQTSTLSWIGSPGTYKLYSGVAPPEDVSSERSCSTGNLRDATSFVLEASAQEGGQTVYLYFTTTVTVVDPSIVANDLTVLTTSALNGAVNVGTAAAAARLTVTGEITASGAANVGSLAAATVAAQSLRSSGSQLGGTTALRGSLSALGTGMGLTAGTWSQPAGWVPQTDGFVIGFLFNIPPWPVGTGYCAYIQSFNLNQYAVGGLGPGCATSVAMPVPSRYAFYLAVVPELDPWYKFYFIPLGWGGVVGPAVIEAPYASGIEPPPTAGMMSGDYDAPKQFVAALEPLLASSIDPATRQQLIEILQRL